MSVASEIRHTGIFTREGLSRRSRRRRRRINFSPVHAGRGQARSGWY